MLVGYARAATQGPSLDQQWHALQGIGCAAIFTDATGGLSGAIEALRGGGTLVVWRLDRLGYSAKNLPSFILQLAERGLHLKSLVDVVDISAELGRPFVHIMAKLAEMERGLAAERARTGLDAARRQGRTGGRTRQMTEAKITAARKLLADGWSPKAVAADLGVSVPTLYRWLPASSRTDS